MISNSKQLIVSEDSQAVAMATNLIQGVRQEKEDQAQAQAFVDTWTWDD